jgi:hypothetical protein
VRAAHPGVADSPTLDPQGYACAVGAHIGPRDNPHRFDVSVPDLMRLVTGISPVAGRNDVRLEEAGFKAVQRLVLADLNGGVLAAVWPGELKPHARYLYSERRAERFVSAALEGGWLVDRTPHVAFHNAPIHQRLYLDPLIDLTRYVELWEGPGWEWIGGYWLDEARTALWPWLKKHGCATARDDQEFGKFLLLLGGKRQAHLRPGLHAERMWSREDVASRPASQVAADVRAEVNRVLGAIGEPSLPVG